MLGCGFRSWFFLCLALASQAGCSSSSGPRKLVVVHGKINVADQPLTLGTISFRPDAAKGNTSVFEPGGKIDALGNYVLFTNAKEGAPPGFYKIVVVATDPIDPKAKDPYAPRKSHISLKYNDVKTSELEVEVVEKPEPGKYDLKLLP